MGYTLIKVFDHIAKARAGGREVIKLPVVLKGEPVGSAGSISVFLSSVQSRMISLGE